jgi:hypothetical protein
MRVRADARMRIPPVALAISRNALAALVFASAGCGRTNPAAPSTIALQSPIIAGDWTQSGTLVTLRVPGASISYGCLDGALTVQQTGARFSGRGYSNGFGNNGAYCRHTFSLTGTVAADGTVTDVRLDPPFPAENCTFIASDGIFQGTVTTATLRVRMTDRWICPNFVGVMTEMDRIVDLAFVRPPAPPPPPGPAPPRIEGFPPLVGQWRASAGIAFEDAQTGASLNGYSCEGSWGFSSQTANEFSGGGSLRGHGFNSDRYCAFNGSVSGRVAVDGTLSDVRMDPAFSTRCTSLSDVVITGLINPDATSAKLVITARGSCLDDINRPRDMHRTVTIVLTRR